MDDDYLPEEVKDLPTFPPDDGTPYSSPYDKSLYVEVRTIPCRRCGGDGTDPDGAYPCLLCHGVGEEPSPDGVKRFCFVHPDKELVRIGKRHVSWEDGQGFDHEGFLEVRGCPICRIAAHSETGLA